MRRYRYHTRRLINIKVPSLTLTLPRNIVIFFDKLSYIFQIKLPKLISIHWHIYIQLFNIRQYFRTLILSLMFWFTIIHPSFVQRFIYIQTHVNIFWKVFLFQFIYLLEKCFLGLQRWCWVKWVVNIYIQFW